MFYIINRVATSFVYLIIGSYKFSILNCLILHTFYIMLNKYKHLGCFFSQVDKKIVSLFSLSIIKKFKLDIKSKLQIDFKNFFLRKWSANNLYSYLE